MSLTIQSSAVYSGNNLLLPDIELTLKRGEPAAVQGDLEWLESFHSLFLPGSPLFIGEVDGSHPNEWFVYLQSDGLYTRLTPKQHIRFWRKLYSNSSMKESDVLALCELSHLANKPVKYLTTVEQRRMHYARCLIMPNEVCLFDQPLLHADRQTKHAFAALLEKLADRYIIITSTSLEDAIQFGKPYRLNERSFHALPGHSDYSNHTDHSDKLDHIDHNDQNDHHNHIDHGEEEQPTLDNNSLAATPFKLQKISAKVEDKYILFDPLEIDYVESYEGQSRLYVNSETFVSPLSLKELEQRLRPFGFFRCHRAYLVNLQRVREIMVWSKNSYSLSLDDRKKSTVPLSKGNYATLKEMLEI